MKQLQDHLQRFIFPTLNVKGQITQIKETHQQIINPFNYPYIIQQLLGEMLTVSSLFTSLLKFEGEITLQLQGKNNISYIAIHGNHLNEFKGIARYRSPIKNTTKLTQLFPEGILIITIIPKNKQQYQGIIPIEHDTMTQLIEQYFLQSEQLNTKIWLSHENNIYSGLLLQQLPHQQKLNENNWNHLLALTSTITQTELALLPTDEILHRLYHQEDIDVFTPEKISYRCNCSLKKCIQTLLSLNHTNLRELYNEKNEIIMDCDYCLTQFHITEKDLINYSN